MVLEGDGEGHNQKRKQGVWRPRVSLRQCASWKVIKNTHDYYSEGVSSMK